MNSARAAWRFARTVIWAMNGFRPAGVPAIAIPFYLAHPRLKTLESTRCCKWKAARRNGASSCCGTSADTPSITPTASPRATIGSAVFGSPETEYTPETYQPRPYSKGFVRNLPNWYAQAHPDEDFAETFAVWLSLTPEQWREQYRGWKALEKLEFVHCLMEEAKNKPPESEARPPHL